MMYQAKSLEVLSVSLLDMIVKHNLGICYLLAYAIPRTLYGGPKRLDFDEQHSLPMQLKFG